MLIVLNESGREPKTQEVHHIELKTITEVLWTSYFHMKFQNIEYIDSLTFSLNLLLV